MTKKWLDERKIKLLNNVWVKGLIEEKKEYTEAIKLLEKYSKGEKLTKPEIHIIQTQLWDTLKLTGLGVLFILPGGSLILVGLVALSKKTGMDILPTAFNGMKNSHDKQ